MVIRDLFAIKDLFEIKLIRYLYGELVFNDSKVLPARLFGKRRGTGANIEFLLSRCLSGDTWETLVRPGRRCRQGDIIDFGDGELSAERVAT